MDQSSTAAAVTTSASTPATAVRTPTLATASLKAGSIHNNNTSSGNLHSIMPGISTSTDLGTTIPSFAAARRARADTLPSRPSSLLQDSSSQGLAGTNAFSLGKVPPGVQRPLRRTPSLLVPPQLSTRHRSGSLTLPSASISAAFGPSIFTSSWGDPDSPNGDRPATTPTTREMLFDSENENAIMSTLDALGLDDPVQSSTGTSSANSMGMGIGMGLGKTGSATVNTNNSSSSSLNNNIAPGISANHRVGVDLRSRSASFASSALSHLELGSSRGSPSSSSSPLALGALTSRSGSINTTAAYQEVLEDEHEDDIGLLNSNASSHSSGASGIYPTGAGGVHQFQTLQQTHSRPRAISMGFLEMPHDIVEEQRKFANAGPRSYSDMKARQTHQRTTSAGADMLSEIVNGHLPTTDKNGVSNGNISSGSALVHGHSHSLSLNYSSQLHAQQQQQQQQQHTSTQRPGHQHSNSFGGRSLADDVAFGHVHGLGNSGSNLSLTNGADPHQDIQTLTGTATPPFIEQGITSNSATAITQQVPTRSLWIGNIDPSFTSNDLMQVFSPFGPVESLKVIPDKECAFINFTRVEDAMRAKEDISERRGGRIGNTTVRVGYGKAELMVNADAPVSHPTRALWIGNIPSSTTPAMLHAMFANFGAIESARVLTHKSCGFINFENMEDAVVAKKVTHGQEIFGPGTGAVRIGFAKVPAKQSPTDSPSLGHGDPLDGVGEGRSSSTTNSQSSTSAVDREAASEDPAMERQAMLREFSDGEPDPVLSEPIPASLTEPIVYFTSIPPVAEPSPHRRLDAPRLREIRKRLDSGHCTQKELDNLSNECIDECVELCSDYIGNTVIQKLFERCSESQKTKMLELIAPHLASIGVHKNGTWAAQKIIDCAKSPAQTELICKHVRPYTPPLLLDQFGNYVVQCCLRLGQSRNGFIFEAMADKFWEIAQGRFGARAMRASLESQHATKQQQKHVAVAVVQNALALATNPNGTLMLTWLLDNSQLPGRYRVLAPRLVPHMVTLATHKLASLTILKVINQRQELDASDIMINSIVNSNQDQVLVEILGDQVHGVSLIQKILASPNVEQQQKHVLAEKVKAVLSSKLNTQSMQGCKRLLEEVNMILGGDYSPTEQAKLTPGSTGYSSAEFSGSATNFYTGMGNHHLQSLAMPSDTSTSVDSSSALNTEGQESVHSGTSTAPVTSGSAHMSSSAMTHASGFSVQHSPYYTMPHGQLYGHYPGQMSPYYGPGAYIPQHVPSMGFGGIIPQGGFSPYVPMPPPGIGAVRLIDLMANS
ncbi:hypothetical protein BCR41DRAFT_366500 [Lobosporangium transversale]|uniref:Armadillo-type protein n=1 Tax=Lobosporangium transversale TaxID=64571 RepID=A0A1Y2H2L6_9FUNG|nr:hypothetical protein BCR41DRAFT_366500 [Lobosporangium transversale]ORZ28775.1 hypothetical protein BCR41DRAFT_366500 [Lobosporangium transversale]|eukprot:XP_021886448.1 hypothetical protein BCR41DRAFT_366500 [Lobosporangium transversale]